MNITFFLPSSAKKPWKYTISKPKTGILPPESRIPRSGVLVIVAPPPKNNNQNILDYF